MTLKRLNPEEVAWVAPETKEAVLGKQLAAETPTFQGEYRVMKVDDEAGTTDIKERVIWVDDAPDKDSGEGSGEGHFEVYDGEPEDYLPNTRMMRQRDGEGES